MGEYGLVDHNGCNGHEDINFHFTGFTISVRVMGNVEAEICPNINGGRANVNGELISTRNDLINDVFTSQGGSYTFRGFSVEGLVVTSKGVCFEDVKILADR